MEVYNMSGYYEWQRQQANERVAARLAEAEAHRQAKMGQDNGEPSIRLRLLFPALFGILIVILLLNGCAPNVTPTGNVDAAFIEVPTMTMAERIEFQDTRDMTFEYEVYRTLLWSNWSKFRPIKAERSGRVISATEPAA